MSNLTPEEEAAAQKGRRVTNQIISESQKARACGDVMAAAAQYNDEKGVPDRTKIQLAADQSGMRPGDLPVPTAGQVNSCKRQIEPTR